MNSPALPDRGPAGHVTGPRLLLGAHLRRLRETSGISREAAGWEIRASESKISRMELGQVAVKQRDLADLLTLYGVVSEPDRASIVALAQRANEPGWWLSYSDILSNSFASFLGLEATAERIHSFEVQLVPGLLQTADYARAVIRTGVGDDAGPSEVDRRVDLRMQRQRRLTGAQPARLWAIVDEAALRRPIGGVEVMRAQLASLIEAVRRPNITLQVLPFRAGGHAALCGSFTLLGFPQPDLPDVVYQEQITGALYLNRPDEVTVYAGVLERLRLQAESPDRTADILRQVVDELDQEQG